MISALATHPNEKSPKTIERLSLSFGPVVSAAILIMRSYRGFCEYC
jgi:hypothetical protein